MLLCTAALSLQVCSSSGCSKVLHGGSQQRDHKSLSRAVSVLGHQGHPGHIHAWKQESRALRQQPGAFGQFQTTGRRPGAAGLCQEAFDASGSGPYRCVIPRVTAQGQPPATAAISIWRPQGQLPACPLCSDHTQEK